MMIPRIRPFDIIVATSVLVFFMGGCMMMGMMGHDARSEGTRANVSTTKVIKESADRDLTLSFEFSTAKVTEPVRYTAWLTKTSDAKPVSGALLRLYSALADSTHQIYSCPMHPEVVADKPGTCPQCGMDLTLRQQPEKRVDPTAPSREIDSLTMTETGTTGVYSSTLTYSLGGSYDISVSVMSVGNRTLEPPIALTATQVIFADHGSHTGGMEMNTTTMIALGATAMALMMILSLGRWF